ncbi:response regulator [Fervidibacillus albus]|uniref:Response regulator n=1 Tax=Fervidibacillus albus TaxID=2980026 RepID=A0A9E8LU15_9BACI|nr:response regulator [Fervidibacillus albus]WAA09642.1 response regulator [Fervidibacillus albus]
MDRKILIVDDQFGIRMLLTELFQKEGYETFQASNGIKAIENVKNVRPNLVLLDIKIPGMDGIDILKELKEIDRNIKVIMMTAYGEMDMIQEAMELGAVAYFTKPFDIVELKKTVKSILQ